MGTYFGNPDKNCAYLMLQSIPGGRYPLNSGTSSLKKKHKKPAVAYGELLKASGASSDLFQEVLHQEDKQGAVW